MSIFFLVGFGSCVGALVLKAQGSCTRPTLSPAVTNVWIQRCSVVFISQPIFVARHASAV